MSNQLIRYSLYAFVALIAFGAGLWVSSSRQADAPEPTASDALYAMVLPDALGEPQSVGQWRGKVVVINFWATWCAPCREEIPIFVKMQEKYRTKGLQFVGISIDHADETSEFARTYSINYPSLIGTFDTVEVSRQAGNKRRVLPYTIVLDRKGEIIATELGGLTEAKLESIIAPLLQ